MSERPSLEALVGQDIGIVVSRLHQGEDALFMAHLHAVEVGGLWIESQHLTEIVLKALEEKVFERTPVFFFPFQMIDCVFSLLDVPAISEKLAE